MSALPLVFAFVIYVADNAARELLRSERRGAHKAGKFDRRSSIFVAMYPLLITILAATSLALNPNLPPAAQWGGVVVMLLGAWVHIAAQRSLGKYYTGTLYVAEKHTVIQDGLYRYVRHPGYSGVLILTIGFGLATGNAYILLVFAALFAAVYSYRIRAEEAMMHEKFGNKYDTYIQGTSRLIPFIF